MKPEYLPPIPNGREFGEVGGGRSKCSWPNKPHPFETIVYGCKAVADGNVYFHALVHTDTP